MEKKNKRKNIIAAVILLAGNAILFLTVWLLTEYDKIYLDQFLFQMKTTVAGVQMSLALSAVVTIGVFGVLATVAEIFLYLLLSGSLRDRFSGSEKYLSYCKSKLCGFLSGKALIISLSVLVCASMFFLTQLSVIAYVHTNSIESDFIEANYVDPESAELVFPEQKRNLIYIFLESMENTFADKSAGESIIQDYIPELTALARHNVSFSNTTGIGGALQFMGTTWTAASMVAQTSGVPVKVSLGADSYGGRQDAFLPGVTSIGEILQQHGYNQSLMFGSDAQFHGREQYFADHGKYNILDIEALKESGKLPEDYHVWWGFEDEKLFEYAKEEITRLAGEGQPFNFTMLTADTHFPDGYLCPHCDDEYEEQYANVLACSSRQIYEFIRWIRSQPFYENTTIVLSGDHLTMDAEFLDDINENYTRTVYNCIINSPKTPVNKFNRQFAVFDMFPTTLSALGVEIKGGRLGLGTDLFSEHQTLAEKYGYEFLDTELQKKSEFYNKEFLGMEEGSTDIFA